ncbi:MAG: response regulator [Gammaproteobacteria bacterium]|nr:MAG: response regulator [Gammaproteobacteria bacterium]
MAELGRILYVEDEPDIRAVAEMALETLGGYEVILCASGEEGVQRAAQERPDFILLDVMMPGMDGIATFEAIRQQPGCQDIPIAFMTAKVQPHEQARFLAMGAVGVIAKPFDPMSLSDQVRTLWEQAHAHE